MINLLSKVKNKRIFLYLFIFIVGFLISFIVTYIFMPVGCDDIWLYGFSSNISKGMIIYRDFNVVTTPLYYFIGSLFLNAFGNYIISLGIFNAIIVSFLVLMMFRIIKWKAFVVFPLILIFFPNGYNLLSLFWLMLILFLIATNKDNDILVAFILGLLFITKQNVGICLLIPYLYYSRHKLNGFIIFFIPFFVISFYLLLNHAFFDFINYCFLGLFDFGTGNHDFDFFVVIELFVLFFLIIRLLISRFQNKEVFYILMFQILMYPLADAYHFFVSFFPVMYYIVKRLKEVKILFCLFLIIFFFTIYLFNSIQHEISLKKDILFLKNTGDLVILMKDFHDYLNGVEYYYFTGYYGYLYKLYYDIPIGQYDLWNEGNMGYRGVEKRIKEVDKICKDHKCLFVVDGDLRNNSKSQVTKFCNYIVNNYEKVDEFNTFYIYSNVNE